MRTPLIASAAALLALAAPAFAAPAKDAPQPTTQDQAAPTAKPNTIYCIKQSVTGSRVPKRICKTRAEWIAANDFDPLAPGK